MPGKIRLNRPYYQNPTRELDSLLLPVLHHRQDVARGIFEPRDHWALISVDAFLIGLNVAFVFLEAYADSLSLVKLLEQAQRLYLT